jgi:hypothetical protein
VEWAAACPGGLQGGKVRIRGLEPTETDVLVCATDSRRARKPAADRDGAGVGGGGWFGVIATYGVLGIDHILSGWDDLLFVFALVLLIRDRRSWSTRSPPSR